MSSPKRIGFIFLDEIHHIYHFISIAIELSKKNNVSILTFPGKHTFLREELKRLGGEKVKIEELSTNAFRAFTDKIKKRRTPRVGFWMNKNKKHLLKDFDALVFSIHIHEKLLKAKKGKFFPKFITMQHGTSGSAYSYNPKELDYDMQLIFGQFQYDHYKKLDLLGNHPVLVGYPKLDAVDIHSKKSFFQTKKPTVLYAPHFSRKYTSYHKFGLEVLDYFFKQKTYNLIFAPHFQLNKKNSEAISETFPKKYMECPHIHVDFGSSNSVDMTYTKSVDIFLGDISSQVFEFMIWPRPCIFLNAHDFQYENNANFRFWQCGPVLDSIDQLDQALKNSGTDFKIYRPIQEKITDENYYRPEDGKTASQRSAEAIESFLDSAR